MKIWLRREGEVVPQGISITVTSKAIYVRQRSGKNIVCTRIVRCV